MATKTSKLTTAMVKHLPWLAVVLAIYQYYNEAGGLQGFLFDLKNLNMRTLQAQWAKIGIGMALFAGAAVVSKFVPGKMKYLVEGIMFYFGASQILDVLQAMYTPAGAAVGNGVVTEVRGY